MRKSYYISLLLTIPLVGIVISLIYILSLEKFDISTTILQISHGIIMTAGLWLGCMAIVDFLWKKFPWEHQPKKHLVIEILFIIVYTMLFSSAIYYIEFKIGMNHFENSNIIMDAASTVLITLFITSIHEAGFFYRQWKFNFSKSVKLEKDNLQAKYDMLKNQINPHFLFNSLNSLISLVEDNDKAVDYIQNLSEFLRYIIKGGDKQVVLVREEIEILKKYLNILKLRFGENLDIRINIPEKYFHYSIPPLTLQMLVENCTKHNIISSVKPLKIKVFATNESIVVENNLQIKTNKLSTGQGLKNIFERYRFFSSREVKIKQTNHTFTVTIPLLLIDL